MTTEDPKPPERGVGWTILLVSALLLGAVATAFWLVASYVPADDWGKELTVDGIIVYHLEGVGEERAERIAKTLRADSLMPAKADARAWMKDESLVIDLFLDRDSKDDRSLMRELRHLRKSLETATGVPVALRLCDAKVDTIRPGVKAKPRAWKVIEE